MHYSALLGMHSVAIDGLCCVHWLSVLIFLFTDDFDTWVTCLHVIIMSDKCNTFVPIIS